MAPVSGTAGSVGIVNSGTTVFTRLKEWSLNITQNLVDVSAMGMSWKEFINGMREFDGNVAFYGDPTDSAETLVRNAIIGGSAAFVFQFYQGTNYYAGSCLPKKFSPKLTYDGALSPAVDLQGTKSLSYN